MNPALHHDGLALPPAHGRLKLIPPHGPLPATYSHYTQAHAPYAITRNNHEPPGRYESPPTKRQRIEQSEPVGEVKAQPVTAVELSNPVGAGRGPRETGTNDERSRGNGVDSRPVTATGAPAAPAVSKSRRVRTGCLTCRERHLKCDEGLPDCNNCRKSNRECKRGVRLNFIDVQVKSPPYLLPPVDWLVQFEDESRLIASEYRGGLGRYQRLDPKAITPPREPELDVVGLRRSSVRSREPSATGLRDVYHPGTSSLAPTPGPTGYDDNQQPSRMSHLSSRKDSGSLPAAQTPASQAGPSPIIGPGSGAFSLTMLQDQYGREDILPRSHVYRGSDASSVASSLVPQGAGPGSQNLRPSALRPGQGRDTPDGLMTPPSERAAGERDYLSDDEEMRFMQVFIDEVAIWMDTLNEEKHFTNTTPYLALRSPMLLNAFLACGVKHLTLVESYNDEKALFYYDTATTQLLRSLQNPDRNMAECATTAVVLNVYEIMSEKPAQRMSHIAGARALIRECGWNANTTGIGGACFWLNIGMEVLSCLHFNWQIAWEPDQWGLDLSFTTTTTTSSSWSGSTETGTGATTPVRDGVGPGGAEEIWAQRMFYIVAKIVNFRANIPRFQEPSPHDEQVRLQSRFSEWKRLRGMCDAWNNNCPRQMQPYGYSHSPSTRSLFPNIWLIKRPAVIGRLFYHTAMCVLAQINPLNPADSAENRAAQLHHAHQVCGIVAHTRDRGVGSVAIRSLATSSSVLTDRQEQIEVIGILEKISKETGWRLGMVLSQLRRDWGWDRGDGGQGMGTGGQLFRQQHQYHQQQQNVHHHQSHQNHQHYPQHPHAQQSPFPSNTTTTTTTTTSTPVAGMTSTASGNNSSSHNSRNSPPVAAPVPMRPLVNPLLVNADFGNRNHPYKNWYEPPNRSGSGNDGGLLGGGGGGRGSRPELLSGGGGGGGGGGIVAWPG